MRRTITTIITIIISLISISAFAQTINGPMSFRKGNLLMSEVAEDGTVIANNRVLDASEIQMLIGDYNYDETYVGAVKQYKVGKNLIISGVCVGIVGIATAFVGGYKQNANIYYAGYATGLVADGLLAAGVPLLCIGKGRMKWLAEDYNERINAQSNNTNHNSNSAKLEFGAHKYGMGLALVF